MSTRDRTKLAAPPPEGTAFLMVTRLAGVQYYAFSDGTLPLDRGAEVALRREPSNCHDERAIEVYTLAGDKLGYVPRSRNTLLARLIDGGHTLRGRLEEVVTPALGLGARDEERHRQPRLKMSIFIDEGPLG